MDVFECATFTQLVQANEEYVAYINIHVVPTSAESCAWFTDRENQELLALVYEAILSRTLVASNTEDHYHFKRSTNLRALFSFKPFESRQHIVIPEQPQVLSGLLIPRVAFVSDRGRKVLPFLNQRTRGSGYRPFRVLGDCMEVYVDKYPLTDSRGVFKIIKRLNGSSRGGHVGPDIASFFQPPSHTEPAPMMDGVCSLAEIPVVATARKKVKVNPVSAAAGAARKRKREGGRTVFKDCSNGGGTERGGECDKHAARGGGGGADGAAAESAAQGSLRDFLKRSTDEAGVGRGSTHTLSPSVEPRDLGLTEEDLRKFYDFGLPLLKENNSSSQMKEDHSILESQQHLVPTTPHVVTPGQAMTTPGQAMTTPGQAMTTPGQAMTTSPVTTPDQVMPDSPSMEHIDETPPPPSPGVSEESVPPPGQSECLGSPLVADVPEHDCTLVLLDTPSSTNTTAAEEDDVLVDMEVSGLTGISEISTPNLTCCTSSSSPLPSSPPPQHHHTATPQTSTLRSTDTPLHTPDSTDNSGDCEEIDADVVDLTSVPDNVIDISSGDDDDCGSTSSSKPRMEDSARRRRRLKSSKHIVKGASCVTDLTSKQLNQWVFFHKPLLVNIFKRSVYCQRHEDYVSASCTKRQALKYQLNLRVFKEEQMELVTSLLLHIFCGNRMKYFSYVMSVLLPECMIRILADVNNITYPEAEGLIMN